jgi:alpha-ketoglutarate-dependent taurine dioxygenase
MSASAIDVRKVAGHIGAEITGIRLSPDLPADIVKLIRDALLEHKVVFVRGQGHLDDASQAGYARLFGDLTKGHPTVPGPEGAPNVFELDAQAGGGKANSWHTDVRRPAAGDLYLASDHAPPVWRRHLLGEHRDRLRVSVAGAEGLRRAVVGAALQ